jgi:hypothetical protein
MVLEEITGPLLETLRRFWVDLVSISPKIVLAGIILVVGYIIGRIVGETIRIFVSRVFGVERWVKQKGLEGVIYNIQISSLLGGLAKWFAYLFFIDAAVSPFGYTELKAFFDGVVNLYPKLVALVAVFLFSIVFGEWLKQQVVGSGFFMSKDIGSLVKFMTVIVIIIIGLEAIGLEVTVLLDVLRIALIGFVGAVSLAMGIALGFALKDEIRPYLKRYLADRLGGREEEPRA